MLIHENNGRVESFVVGHRMDRGEKCMWVVNGGVWKASFVEEDTDGEERGLLITEVSRIPRLRSVHSLCTQVFSWPLWYVIS